MKIKKAILPIILFLVCSFLLISNNTKTLAQVKISPSNTCSEIVMERDTNRVLFENNAREKRFMASTTKILTAITIIENCDLNEIVTITNKTVGVEGSSIYLEAGEKLSVKHLLYGLMLRSGNDCAETLAVHCSKSIKEFACLMNETAKKIGAIDSNFVNPHGLHDDNHYTTAYDLALISCYAMNNECFREIVSTKSIKIPFTTREFDRVLINKNKLLNSLDGATGIKTGYTKKAGRCLVSSALRDGMEVICVVLNCPPMFERSTALINESFNNYKPVKLVEADNFVDIFKIDSKVQPIYAYIMTDIIVPLTIEEENNIVIKYVYDKNLTLTIKKDTQIGNIKIYCLNNLLFVKKIYSINDVD